MTLVGKQIGNYIAKSELGRGGMGVVYLAEHPLIGKKVAVKVLHEELAINEQMVHRLWLEAKSASAISSDHVVEVIDFGRIDLGEAGGEKRETVYLAMELLVGRSLADLFWSDGIALRDSIDIARQICAALAASHAAGIVHRDLKPENVHVLEREGDRKFIKILDFGIAKLVANPYTRTRTGVLLGTPAYMSPEQCRGSGEVDFRSDVYSLGVMLYELTSGTLPFAAKGFGDVLVAQMTKKPEPPSTYNPNIPKNVEALILCALEKKPDDRFQSMTAMGAALANIAAELDETRNEMRVTMSGRSEAATAKEGKDSTNPTIVDAAEPDLHVRATQMKDDLHVRATRMKIPEHKTEPDVASRSTVKAPPGTKPQLNQRLPGMALKDVLGSTGAVRELQQKLDQRGAKPPVAPDAPRQTIAVPHDEEAKFLDEEKRQLRFRMIAVGVVLLIVIVLAAIALR